jgi:hypothetical protein
MKTENANVARLKLARNINIALSALFYAGSFIILFLHRHTVFFLIGPILAGPFLFLGIRELNRAIRLAEVNQVQESSSPEEVWPPAPTLHNK